MKTEGKKPEDAVIIEELAKRFNITKRTLHLHHEMGLLEPCYVDQQTGTGTTPPPSFHVWK